VFVTASASAQADLVMKVLLVHNFYRSSAPSGEDIAYTNERCLLEERGVEVVRYERHNDDLENANALRLARAAIDTVWSRQTYHEVKNIIQRENPDLAHIHGIFPQVSPSVYQACYEQNLAVVQTLHNFRLICPGALLLREQAPCEKCLGTSLLPAIQHRCYRNSLAATTPLVTMLAWHRYKGTFKNTVNRYLALSRFAAEKLSKGGIPAERLTVRHNFLPDPPQIGTGSGNYLLYVGRLTAEKGVETLLTTWQSTPRLPRLLLVGDGSLRATFEQRSRQGNLAVKFMGNLPRKEVLKLMRDALAVIIPSQCYETFSLVAMEAYACGTPVIASNLGNLREVVVPGVTGEHFSPGNTHSLTQALQRLLARGEHLTRMRNSCRLYFNTNFTAERAFDSLMKIYNEVLYPVAINESEKILKLS
jgi:glycosyltransferase involved in cell wall biosynthesis